MPAEITMPQLSDTMSEGTLVKWVKREGEKVKEGDVVAEVETDKAVMPMESFDSGTLAAQLVKEGDKVKVGTVIAVIARAGEDVEAVRRAGAGGAAKPATAAAVVAGGGAPSGKIAGGSAGTAILEAPVSERVAPAGGGANGSGASGGTAGGRIRVSPLASRLAGEKGVDLSQIRGTGPNGRIHVRDVEEFLKNPHAPTRAPVAAPAVGGAGPQVSGAAPASKPAAPALPAVRVSGSKEVIPLTKMRQVIAQRLQQSKQTVPHFYTTVDVDMEAAMSLRERVNQQLEKEKLKISVNDLVMKAVAMALVRHPEMNAHYRENGGGGEIHRFADVNLGVAVALPDGLIVPVLRGVQNMGLREIKIRTADLVERARSQRLKGDEMTGGTFTISNLGAWGVKDFGAIVNPPEVGILAVGAAEQRAVVYKGQLAARYTMSLTLSGDHRAVDGATAAEFCRTLKGMLEEPGMMLV